MGFTVGLRARQQKRRACELKWGDQVDLQQLAKQREEPRASGCWLCDRRARGTC